MKKQILIVCEVADRLSDLVHNIRKNEIDTEIVQSLQEAVYSFIKQDFCLILITEEMAKKDDYHLVRAMKKARTTPILVLSSHQNPHSRLAALKAGAHGYLDSSYSVDECITQAVVLLEMYYELIPQTEKKHIISFGKNLLIDESTRQVIVKGKEVKFTKKEFDVLHCLASNPGKVFTREQLYDRLWDEQSAFNIDEVIKTHIKTIRQKLSEADAEYIKNVWGVGYRFHHEEAVE